MIYRKVDGTTLYLRGDAQDGYTLYSGEYIGGSSAINRTLTSVVVENAISYSGSCSNMFISCMLLTSLDLSLFDTSNVTSMASMFANCSSLTSLDLSLFDTSNVALMISMFANCSSLTSLDLSGFDTSNVTHMHTMFKECSSLTSLDLSNFNTSRVSKFSYETYDSADVGNNGGMFGGCSSLETLKIDNFTKSSSAYAYEMFYGCSSLTTIECSNTFNSSNSTGMFSGCTSLQGETSKGGIAYNSSKTTGTYAKINGGYFTYPKRTITTSITSGSTITGAGTYDKGTEVTIVATPDSATYQYLHSLAKNGTEVLPSDTISAYSYTFNVNEDCAFVGTCLTRAQYTLSATSTYTIQGTGTYRYLDQPTLIAELGGGLITFNGWYEGSTLMSNQNPWKLTMPNRNLSLTIQTGENPFSNRDVRQFCLQNKDGTIYNLTDSTKNWYLNIPDGLGISMGYSQERFGNSANVDEETYTFPSITGEILFKGDRSTIYQNYYDFARFITNSPIELWYKTPNGNTHHIPVEVTALVKGEIQTDKMLHCTISMTGTGFWKATESTVSASTSTVQVLNDSDFDIGFEITLAKLDGTTFTNPRVTFNNGEEYGVIAFDSIGDQEFDEIKIVTKDGKQDIILSNGDSVITNPFAYIDFSYADGSKQFPFPKLAKGYTTISFLYDDSSTEGKSYYITYDKEFASV